MHRLVAVAAVLVFGIAGVAGAIAAVHHFSRGAQPRVGHLSCHQSGGRITLTGVAENPDGKRRLVAVLAHYRLAGGKLRYSTSQYWIPAHGTQRWQFDGSGLPMKPVVWCSAAAWFDDEED